MECGEWVFNWIVFHSGTAWAGRNRPSITKSREWSGRSTYKCTLTGTPGITIGSGSRKRNGNATGRTTQVNLHGPPYSYTTHSSLQWHALTKNQQSKYYEMARHERNMHMQMHPNWSARENYAKSKKKRKKKDKVRDGNNGKKNKAVCLFVIVVVSLCPLLILCPDAGFSQLCSCEELMF